TFPTAIYSLSLHDALPISIFLSALCFKSKIASIRKLSFLFGFTNAFCHLKKFFEFIALAVYSQYYSQRLGLAAVLRFRVRPGQNKSPIDLLMLKLRTKVQ